MSTEAPAKAGESWAGSAKEKGMQPHRANDGRALGSPPLVVDLDGTLVHGDLLIESALRALRERPLDVLRMPGWLVQGKAALKRHLAERTGFDPASLPYHRQLLDWLQKQRLEGRRLVLCTAADHSIAAAVADHLGIFDEVIASDGRHNLSGANKAALLERRFGGGGFDYAGNAPVDLAVWRRARRAVLVNANGRLTGAAARCCEIEQVFPPRRPDLVTLLRMLRVHQWLKNLLLFVPVLAAHQFTDPDVWYRLLLAFCAFNLCASSVYIGNDLLDLDSDRQHPRKAGVVPPRVGLALAPVLLAAGAALGSLVGGAFLAALAAYFALTCAYSLGLKRLPLVDCLTLALLYMLRVVAGAAAVGMSLSFWLLAFSVFLFLSLAFVKRYAELRMLALDGKDRAHGRGYAAADAQLIQIQGMASGYVAVLVLSLYLDSEEVLRLYRSPEFVWGAVLAVLFWINWIWLVAHRGRMHDDPLVFAVKDRTSLAAGGIAAAFMAFGTVGGGW
jgi:4-hydroxybenzoate polyprenyltransferase